MTATNIFTVTELITYIKSNRYTKTNETHSYTSTDASWTGTKTLGEAIKLLETGDSEITKKLKDTTRTKMEALNSKPSSYIPDVQGDFFDVGLLLTGEPECYFKLSHELTTKPRVDLKVVINTSSSTRVDTLIENASNLLVKIKQFELNDIQVKLSVISKSSYMTKNHDASYIEVLVKDYKDGINYRKLSGIIHPSFNRRILFRMKELQFPTNLRLSYGRPIRERDDIRLDTNSTILNIGVKDVITD